MLDELEHIASISATSRKAREKEDRKPCTKPCLKKSIMLDNRREPMLQGLPTHSPFMLKAQHRDQGHPGGDTTIMNIAEFVSCALSYLLKLSFC